MAFQRTFMYDGAVSDLQPIIPLTSEIEMKSDLNAILMMKRTKPTVNSLKLLYDGTISIENMLNTFSIYGHANFF
jgi:hypothetical protein